MPSGYDQGACASKYMYSAVRIIGTATAAARQTERQNAHTPGCSRLPMVRNPASVQCTRAHHQLKTPECGLMYWTTPRLAEGSHQRCKPNAAAAARVASGVVSTRWRMPFATYAVLCQLTVVDTESPTVRIAQRREHSSSKKRRVANRTRSIKKVSFRTHPHHSAPAQRPSRGANRTQRGVVSTRWRMPFATYVVLCQLTVVDTESPTVRTTSRAQQQQEGGGKPHAQHQEG